MLDTHTHTPNVFLDFLTPSLSITHIQDPILNIKIYNSCYTGPSYLQIWYLSSLIVPQYLHYVFDN